MQQKEHIPSIEPQHSFRVDNAIAAMESIVARELSPSLAASYMRSLTDHIGNTDSYEHFLQQGKEVHRQLGRDVYGPLIVGFIEWAEQTLKEKGIASGPVHFALRDAWPFYTAAHVLWDGTAPYHAVGTYINRPLLGIEDELAPEKTAATGFVEAYLASSGFTDTGKPIALIDSGAWGTVVRSIKERHVAHTPFYPLFWYSHNPAIPGFINHVLETASIPSDFGEVINDSLECVFPQSYRRPVSFDEAGGKRFLTLEKADALSIAWGQAALEGVEEAAHRYKSGIASEDVLESIRRLYALHKKTQETGEWTGVLPTHTPTWSKGADFIAAWPKDLLP